MAAINRISPSESLKLNLPLLFKDSTINNCFAVLSNDKTGFIFSWHSDLIEPTLTQVSSDVYSLGIDQNFAIIDMQHGIILMNLSLSFNFVTNLLFGGRIFVITELEVIEINAFSFTVSGEFSLPDTFRMFSKKDDALEIQCTNGFVLSLH